MASKFLSLDQKCSKLSSAHHNISSSDPEQWLWEQSTCVFNVQETQTENGQRDPNNSYFFPLHARWGRTTNPCSSHAVTILGRRCRPGMRATSIPTSSILHLQHNTWHPSILLHLSSPGPISVFLNSPPNTMVSKRIPRDAPRIQGHRLPTTLLHTSLRLDNHLQTS